MRLILVILWLAWAGLGAGAAQAQEVYTIPNIQAFAESDDATQARAKAMEMAEKDAFQQLLKQLSLDGDPRYYELPSPQISRLVSGYEVVSEQVGGKTYRATVNISFNAEQVRGLSGYLAQQEAAARRQAEGQDAPTSASQSIVQRPARILMIPVLRTRDRLLLWEEENRWKSAWSAVTQSQAGDRLVVPQGDADDQSLLDRQKFLRGDAQAFTQIQDRYKTDQVMVAEAWVQPSAGRVNRVQVRLRPALKQMGRMTDAQFALAGTQEEPVLLAKAAEEVAKRLTGEPSMPQAGGETLQEKIKIIAPLKNLSEWIRLKRELESVQGVRNIQVIAITPTQADIVVDYAGPAASLASLLGGKGHKMMHYERYWVLQPQFPG